MPINQSQRILNRFKRYWAFRTAYNNHQNRTSKKFDKPLERQVQLIALLFMGGMVLSYVFGVKTMLSWWQISQFYAGFALVTCIIPLAILPKVYRVYPELKALLVIFGLPSVLTGILLSINIIFASSPYTEIYKIKRAEYFVSNQIIEIELEHDAYQTYYEIRKVPMSALEIFTPDSAYITFANGLLGIKTFKKIELK